MMYVRSIAIHREPALRLDATMVVFGRKLVLVVNDDTEVARRAKRKVKKYLMIETERAEQ